MLGELVAFDPPTACSKARRLRVGAAQGSTRLASEAATASGDDSVSMPLIALVARGGCPFAQKVRRIQALNRIVWRDARLQARERRRSAGTATPEDLSGASVEYPDDADSARFAAIVITDLPRAAAHTANRSDARGEGEGEGEGGGGREDGGDGEGEDKDKDGTDSSIELQAPCCHQALALMQICGCLR